MIKPSLLRWCMLGLVLFTACDRKDDDPECTRSIPPVILVNLQSPGYVCLHETQIAELSAGQADQQYLWNTGATTNPIEVGEPGIYRVTISDTGGIELDSFMVQIYDCDPPDLIAVPTSFTPNNDGVNDIWFPVFADACGIDLQVRDLNGNKMYETSSFNEGWNGENIFENLPAPMGTYFYTAKVTFENGSSSEHTGEVLLIR